MQPLPRPVLIGVIHLPALPGSPQHQPPTAQIIERAVSDAVTLERAGFAAAIIENFGDIPFFAERIEPGSIAAMAMAAAEVRRATRLVLGINALRNDALAALGIAAATGAAFIRVNVHTGVYATDQGLIEGRAGETLRYRHRLGADIGILADVHVKHAAALYPADIAVAARETAYRGCADALIVTGSATGVPVNLDDLRQVKAAAPDRPVLVGSGASVQTVRLLLEHADGVIVGTAIKHDGQTTGPVNPDLARAFVEAAGH
ncbi:MAG TPA: BtpA/SgcQ family protein [Phycisphaerae bacterium]